MLVEYVKMITMHGVIIVAIIGKEKHTLVFTQRRIMTHSMEREM